MKYNELRAHALTVFDAWKAAPARVDADDTESNSGSEDLRRWDDDGGTNTPEPA